MNEVIGIILSIMVIGGWLVVLGFLFEKYLEFIFSETPTAISHNAFVSGIYRNLRWLCLFVSVPTTIYIICMAILKQ